MPRRARQARRCAWLLDEGYSMWRNPAAQGPPVHATELAGFAPLIFFKHQGQRQHPLLCIGVIAPPRRLAEHRRVIVARDCQSFRHRSLREPLPGRGEPRHRESANTSRVRGQCRWHWRGDNPGTGLNVGRELDPNSTPKGLVAATAEMARRNIQRANFHGARDDPIAPSNHAMQTKRWFPGRP